MYIERMVTSDPSEGREEIDGADDAVHILVSARMYQTHLGVLLLHSSA